MKKYLLMCGALYIGCSPISHADDVQKFYDDGYELMVEFRKCSTIKNQLGAETSACLNKAEKSIGSKIREFESKHKIEIQQRNRPFNGLIDTAGFVQSQKNNCKNLYPNPLQPVFKNLIKSCQVQVDLNRYMYLSNAILGDS